MEDTKNDEASSAAQAGLLSINQLSYQFGRDLSVAVARSMQTCHAQQTTYAPGDTMTFIVNSGSAYINPRTSWLEMDIKNTSTGNAVDKRLWFGTEGGGGLNLINRLTIFSRSGAIIERIDRCNVLSAISLHYQHDDSYLKANASAFGKTDTIGDLDWPKDAIIRLCIPLHMFSPLFSSVDTLLPAQLMSGLRFELTLESAANACVALPPVAPPTADVTPSYEVIRVQMQMDSYMLSDISLRVLNQAAAANSLEITATTCHNTISSRVTSSLNLDSGKSVSRALGSVFKERPASATYVQNSERFASKPFDTASFLSQYQLRIGSLYFPQSQLTGDSARISSPSLYSQTLTMWDRFFQGSGISCSVSEKRFRQSQAAVAQTLERSNVLSLSGVPLSNSRILSLNAQFAGTDYLNPIPGTQIDFFLYYVTLLRVYNSSVIVEV